MNASTSNTIATVTPATVPPSAAGLSLFGPSSSPALEVGTELEDAEDGSTEEVTVAFPADEDARHVVFWLGSTENDGD